MKSFCLHFLFAFCFVAAQAQGPWPAAQITARPQTRWWWMGNAVDGQNISTLLKQYSAAGIGGVEIVPIYGAKGFEKRYINYLSPQWINMLDTTVAAAKKQNMLVDISIGSGWPIGGSEVALRDAATKMEVKRYGVKAGERVAEKIRFDGKGDGTAALFLAALMAYSENEKPLDLSGFLTADSMLNWSPKTGTWTVIALFNSKTFQKVKRAAPGGEGYTLDHFSTKAVDNYIRYFDQHFGESSHGVRSLYNDSYEVFNADWSPDFFAGFKRLRGYDLKDYLPQLTAEKVMDSLTGRIKSDYRETLSQLILNNFTRRMAGWAHSKKAVFLNQAHGSPGNLLDLYAAVDIPETETFGSSVYPIPGLRRSMYDPRIADTEPLMFKFASSAAHTMGNPLTSSETHTWLTEHFKTNLALCKPEAENLFLSGVNQIMFHGTTYSPADVPFPGWQFYASVNFNPSNSIWPHLKAYTNYITRCQTVLQAGEPDNEILMYWPVYDIWNSEGGTEFSFRAHNTKEWIPGTDLGNKSQLLKRHGYSFDYASDAMIQQAFMRGNDILITENGAAYKTIYVPALKMMALPTLQRMLQLARNGATIIFQNLPKDVPGLSNLQARQNTLKATLDTINNLMQNGVAVLGKGKIIITKDVIKDLAEVGLPGEEIAGSGLQFIRRSIGGDAYYFVVNHTDKTVDDLFSLNKQKNRFVLLDPQSGEAALAAVQNVNGKSKVRLQLKPGETVIVQSTNKLSTLPLFKYENVVSNRTTINSNWTLNFTAGGPSLPATRGIGQLKLWSDLADTTYQNFSGTGVYSTQFNLNKKAGKEYLLQLNELYETARIVINGNEAGFIYSVPYELRIGKYLKQGKNKIEIEVCNLMANRMRYMDRNKIVWKNYHEINFVNKDYKAFDASNWETMPSGLKGPVTILEF